MTLFELIVVVGTAELLALMWILAALARPGASHPLRLEGSEPAVPALPRVKRAHPPAPSLVGAGPDPADTGPGG